MNFSHMHNEHLNPEQHESTKPSRGPANEWVTFTKRTEDPKLAYIEKRLDNLNIPHRRNGSSCHAPILEVQRQHLSIADAILEQRVDLSSGNRTYSKRLDDIPDDDRMFQEQ